MPVEPAPIESKSRIPVTLVTGFFGGKTTVINAALRSQKLANLSGGQ
jgi:hypothetical protein